jgi:hypothetical protein
VDRAILAAAQAAVLIFMIRLVESSGQDIGGF